MAEQGATHGPLPTIPEIGYEYFAIVIYILSSVISLAVFVYGMLIIIAEPSVWHSIIVQVLMVAQITNCIRFIIRLIASFVAINSNFGCRVILFLNNALTLLPVNLCVFCVAYLQIVVIHKVPLYKKWPRIILMAFAVLTAIVPAGSYLVIPTHDLGIESFCHLPIVYTLEQYTYNMLTIALWQYLSGVVGVVSVTIIGIHILWTRRRAQHVLARSIYSSGYSRDVVEQSRSNILHSTMLNIIWYPITPIISLWLNIILISVAYYKQRTYMAAEFINVALLGLQSVFLGVALILNPNIREAFNKNAKVKWRYSRERKTSRARGPDDAHTQQEPPRPEILSTGSLDGTDSTLSALDNV